MKKPDASEINKLYPDIPGTLIVNHLQNLSGRYFSSFTKERIADHVNAVFKVSGGSPVELLVDKPDGKDIQFTVVAEDAPFVFSLITGILSSMGFNIVSGDIFTYNRKGRARRYIIDRFQGEFDKKEFYDDWESRIGKPLNEIFRLLSQPGMLDSAKQRVNEMATKFIQKSALDPEKILFPVDIMIGESPYSGIRLSIISQDTPFFLYSLANALSVQDISIEHVHIQTIDSRIIDEFDILDQTGTRPLDEERLSVIKLSVLLTKQFTYFLGKAPDPYSALQRFELLVKELLSIPGQGKWFELLSSPGAMQNLAMVLGASDFLWEDFIRIQYESLVPSLASRLTGQKFSHPVSSLQEEMDKAIASESVFEGKKKALNDFKDREIYLIDLDYILDPDFDFLEFSRKLTVLAECVVKAALKLSVGVVGDRNGTPRSVAGIKAELAVLGLGKLGGAALGYASDIELLFVYSDSGFTDGQVKVSNQNFFEQVVSVFTHLIETKREGIFTIDLRLRPYGINGPAAVSLERFCQYYGPGGEAHALEKLALVRMRTVAGDREFGSRVERLRDEMVYNSKEKPDIAELKEARERQFRDKKIPGRYNAKFDPGTLADLEYDVQILQVLHGEANPGLKTPLLHKALLELKKASILSAEETTRLLNAYDFFRKLINGLRMLRGTALDLYLPVVDSMEYFHLARRIGYVNKGDLSASEQLHLEFETFSAIIRTFVERHFGRDSLPDPMSGNIADLILSPNPGRELKEKILSRIGFKDINKAFENCVKLAGEGEQKIIFSRLAILLSDMIKGKADPDRAFNNWEIFAGSLQNITQHFEILLSQPMRFEILLDIFAASQALSGILIRNPDFFDFVTVPSVLHSIRDARELLNELNALSSNSEQPDQWLKALRKFKQREQLRIAIKDVCFQKPLEEITHEISILADSIISAAYMRQAFLHTQKYDLNVSTGHLPFCILAFGKLGGNELNYSSDIDLVAFYDEEACKNVFGRKKISAPEFFAKVMEAIRNDLSRITEHGFVYRVDLRLRPYGASGMLVSSLRRITEYYRETAALWEVQAALKLRPVAGKIDLGESFLLSVRPRLLSGIDRESVVKSIDKLRQRKKIIRERRYLTGIDVKEGEGGIRDIEFLVQGLQLVHMKENPDLLIPNTLQAIKALNRHGILRDSEKDWLESNYINFRRVEHFLQLFEDQQVHELPKDEEDLLALGKKFMGREITRDEFLEFLETSFKRVKDLRKNRLFG
ncbi:MAG: glutamate-ammonia-ligase adenylyltransferase [Spirochaetales bacterium]|nr:glutamate-ammonia-ligase adenylyltransferase [Spirochaetales bacterium]